MFSHISLQNEREEVERQKEYFSKLRADFQPDGQKVKIIALKYTASIYIYVMHMLQCDTCTLDVSFFMCYDFSYQNYIGNYQNMDISAFCTCSVISMVFALEGSVYWLLKGVWHVNGWCVGISEDA